MEISVSVCFRFELLGRGICVFCFFSRFWFCLIFSLMVVFSRLVGEMERCRNISL